MYRFAFVNRTCIAVALAGALAGSSHAAIDIDLQPGNQVVTVGEIVEVHLIVSTDGVRPQSFDALDAVFTWNPAILSLIGLDDSNAGATFFVSDFLPDPDGINTSLTDGDALYTALGPPGSPIPAPVSPGNLIVTTFKFQALAPTTATHVVLIPDMGAFGETRVLLNGSEVTGDIFGPASITINAAPVGCAADIVTSRTFMPPPDGKVDGSDLAYLLGEWGINPGSLADLVTSATFMPPPDGVVDGADLAFLLGEWGKCD